MGLLTVFKVLETEPDWTGRTLCFAMSITGLSSSDAEKDDDE